MISKPKAPLSTNLSLESRMAAIGIMIASSKLSSSQIDSVDIESVIASMIATPGIELAETRFPALLLAWIKEHGAIVIIEKLERLLLEHQQRSDDVTFVALCASLASFHGHKRWSPLIKRFAPKKPKFFGSPDLAESLVRMRGKEKWASSSGFVVPKGSLELNGKLVLSPSRLAHINRQYRNRLVFGAQWRADIITAIQRGAATPAEATRISGASYEPCHRVFADLNLAGWPDIKLRHGKIKDYAA